MGKSTMAVDWSHCKPVTTYEKVDLALFQSTIQPAQKPAILRGLVSDWPIVKAGLISDQEVCAYVGRHATDAPANCFFAPPEIRGRFGYGADLQEFNFDVRSASVETLLNILLRLRDVENPPSMYAGALPFPQFFPTLSIECPMPLLEPKVATKVSLWIGNQTRTAAHWDLPQNLACVVAGKRRFTLFPIEQLNNLYIGPLDHTLAGQPISLVNISDPDFTTHPRFTDAIKAAQIADLEPGDVLYMPSLWIHHVESKTPVGMLVNFWWRDGPEHLVTPSLTLQHALLTLRDLPKAEKQAWKVVFDHYIFQSDEDPMAHIPELARGVFGPITPDSLEKIKTRLRQSLDLD
jgi:hypothetical protein